MTRIVSPQMRWLVAVLMTVALPVCCCNGQLLSRAIAHVTTEHAPAEHDTHETLSMGMQAVGGHHHADRGCCPSDSGDDTLPCKSSNSCGCGQSARHLAFPDLSNTLVVFANQFAAVLPYRADTIQEQLWSRAEDIGCRGVLRSHNSLLGQHCAHII